MRPLLALPALLLMILASYTLCAQAMDPSCCTIAFQQRVQDVSADHTTLVDPCLIKAMRASPEKWQCRIVTIHPEALRAAFEERIDSSSTWQQIKVQNSDRLFAQRIGQAMNVDHVMLSTLNEGLENALTGSKAALGQFQEVMATGAHITGPKSHAFKHFRYKAILVETKSGKVIWKFSFETDLTKSETIPLCERLSRKFIRKFPLRTK